MLDNCLNIQLKTFNCIENKIGDNHFAMQAINLSRFISVNNFSKSWPCFETKHPAGKLQKSSIQSSPTDSTVMRV